MGTKPNFDNLPNFRQAGGKGIMTQHGQRVRDGLLYRSSRTDFLTDEEKAHFQHLGIKSIIDLRRKSEYERADGDKVLDDMYVPCVVKHGKVSKLKPSLRWGGGALRKRKPGRKDSDTTDAPPGKRYLVNMFTMDLIWYIFSQVNFFIRYLTLILVLLDWLFGSQLFVRFFTWAVLNRQTLAQQYVTLLVYTKSAVAEILRLIIEGGNVPVLIHCAHGKDRTGLIVAVILGCLEVDDETIAQDYAKSHEGLASIRERVLEETVYRYGFSKESTKAEAETMREVLRELRKRYGSISEYLVSAGFTLEEQKKLRDLFLQPADSDEEED